MSCLCKSVEKGVCVKKIVTMALLFAVALFSFAQAPSIRLGVLKGISCAPCAYLIENKAKLAVQNMEFLVFDSEQAELPKLLRGELDMGFLTAEDAAKVFTAGKGALLLAGVVQNGNAVLLTSDESYHSLEDLRGKTILCGERNACEVAVFKSILSKNGIVSDSLESANSSVQFDFSVPMANIANKLITGEEKYALLSEPFASVAVNYAKNVRRAEIVQKLYAESEEGSSYPALVLVVRADFAQENHALVSRCVEVYRESLTWTNKNPSKAALLSEKHKLGLSQNVVRASIPNAQFLWRSASAAKLDFEKYLTVLGREIPNEEFYFFP